MPVRRESRLVRRQVGAVLAAGVALVMLGVTTPAWAHVGITGATTGPDGVTTVEFAWDHGCDGQATTALEMQLPEGAVVGASTLPAGWSGSGEGRVLRLDGPAIPDGTPAGFTLELTGYDTSVEHLVPTLQFCPDGEEAWIGADPDASDSAPRIAATTAEPPVTTTTTGAPNGADAGDSVGEVTRAANESLAADSGPPWGTIIAVTAGLAVVVAAVVLLVSRSRQATN
jgi:periplasmic copper chaperone A